MKTNTDTYFNKQNKEKKDSGKILFENSSNSEREGEKIPIVCRVHVKIYIKEQRRAAISVGLR